MQYAIEYYDAANGSKYNGESVMYSDGQIQRRDRRKGVGWIRVWGLKYLRGWNLFGVVYVCLVSKYQLTSFM